MLAWFTFISVVLMSTCHFGPQSAACSDLIAGSCRNIHHRADIPNQRISTHRVVGDNIDGAFSVLTIPLSFFSNLFWFSVLPATIQFLHRWSSICMIGTTGH